VRPQEALARLDPRVPVLLIGGGADERVPPDVVRAAFAALPTEPGRKLLWIRDGSEHGQVWLDDPAGYRERLGGLLGLVGG
jgi:fermentation-respiration switch protein FrsA (DUF1100 family)